MTDSEQETSQRIVVNRGFGGFRLHDDTVSWLREQGCEKAEELALPGEAHSDGSQRPEDDYKEYCYPRGDDMPRDDPHLAQAVEENVAMDLDIVEIPEGVDWCITEYDGAETVREKHRTFPSGELETGIANSYEVDDDGQ